jgi:hypothetical protein
VVIGAATGSVDALGRHAYGIEAGWSSRARPDWQIAYSYDRWRPTLFTAVSDDTDPWREGERRIREVDVGVLVRLSRVRFSHATFASVHAATETFVCVPCAPPLEARLRTRSLRLGWDFTNARSFGYSISSEEGGRFSVTTEVPRKAFGSDGNGVSLTADGRRYWHVRPRHGVMAIRAAAAGSWGRPETRKIFSASGSGPQSAGLGFGVDAIGLLRGFEEDDVLGTRAVVANADYRVPLKRIGRGVGTVPVFVRTVHGALFVDAGHAWTDAVRWSEMRLALGAEVSVDAVVGFALPVTFTAGAAWRRDGMGTERGVVAFGRIGRAF